MLAKKLETAPVSPVNGADVLAVLDRRLSELEARRALITETIVSIEKTVGAGRDGLRADLEQAEAVLAGEKFVVSREKPVSQLTALHAEREVIDRALKIGRSRQHRAATERAGEIWAQHFGLIAEIEKKRVWLGLQLQQVNRERERLREKITLAGGAGFLSTDGIDLLGLGDVHDEIRWAAERLIADGICSRREIEKACQ